MVTGVHLSQWKNEPFQGQPITYGLWSRWSPPSFPLDLNNLNQTRGSPGATALLANEGVDFGPWAGLRLHGSGGMTAVGAIGSSWRHMTAARAWRGFVGAQTGGGRGGAEWSSANRSGASARATEEWRRPWPMGGRGGSGGAGPAGQTGGVATVSDESRRRQWEVVAAAARAPEEEVEEEEKRVRGGAGPEL